MTEIAAIDHNQAMQLLRQAVELRGRDTEVEVCRYVWRKSDGLKPGCLIGQALAIHGVPLELMADWESGSYSEANGVAIDDSGIPHYPWLTADAIRVFAIAQDVQDAGHTWGEALDAVKGATPAERLELQ